MLEVRGRTEWGVTCQLHSQGEAEPPCQRWSPSLGPLLSQQGCVKGCWIAELRQNLGSFGFP